MSTQNFMSILTRKKQIIKPLTLTLSMLFALVMFSAQAQDYLLTSSEIEILQDQDMEYMKQIHEITKDYPAFSYNYTIEDGEVKDVTVTGIDNFNDKKRLEVVLFDLKSNKNMLKNQPNRVGVFYSVDQPAKYNGDLTEDLLSNLKYPSEAKDWGLEGTIYVKFVVEDDGEINFASTSSNVDTSVDMYLDDLQEQAVAAVKATSGNWTPAKVEGVEVSSLEIVPVTFDFKKNPTLPALIR
ncbi:energy transducer TonB [Algoriphagus yeomjeoni]|uniref:energy transducer TonB n=1 Tax=Algoriphagus yeomjeoni TaxID=291403 RepID=UPI003CE5557D